MIRHRWLAGLALLIWVVVAPATELWETTPSQSFYFWDPDSAGDVKLFRCAAPVGSPGDSGRVYTYLVTQDTTGNGTALTIIRADSSWRPPAIMDGTYDFWYYDSSRAILVLDDYRWGGAWQHPQTHHPDSTYPFRGLAVDSLHANDSTRIAITDTLDAAAPLYVPSIMVDSIAANDSTRIAVLNDLDLAADIYVHRAYLDTLSANDSSQIAIVESVAFDSTVTVGAWALPLIAGTSGQMLITNGSNAAAWSWPTVYTAAAGIDTFDIVGDVSPMRLYCAAADSGDGVLVSWWTIDLPLVSGTGDRPMTLGGKCVVDDTLYFNWAGQYAGGDSVFYWEVRKR